MQETEMVDTQMQVSAHHLEDVEAQREPETEEKKWRDMERSIFTRVIQGTAGASIVLNIVAMALYGGAAIAMGLIALFVGSVVIYFQFMLQDTDSEYW